MEVSKIEREEEDGEQSLISILSVCVCFFDIFDEVTVGLVVNGMDL